jgi:hypothetical protein
LAFIQASTVCLSPFVVLTILQLSTPPFHTNLKKTCEQKKQKKTKNQKKQHTNNAKLHNKRVAMVLSQNILLS